MGSISQTMVVCFESMIFKALQILVCLQCFIAKVYPTWDEVHIRVMLSIADDSSVDVSNKIVLQQGRLSAFITATVNLSP
jgi:hypothetical protein